MVFCKHCGSENLIRWGSKGNKQQWFCKDCKRYFLHGQRRKKEPKPIEFNFSLGYVLGVLMGDGSLTATKDYHYFKGNVQVPKREATRVIPRTRYNIQLSVKDKDFIDEFSKHLEILTGRKTKAYPIKRTNFKKSTLKSVSEDYEFRGFNLRLTAKEWYFKLKPLLENLKWIKKSKREVKIGFIKGMMDSDASMAHKKSRVTLYNTNLNLLYLVKELLQNIGIHSTVYEHIEGVSRLDIFRKKDVEKYIKLIGFTIKRKRVGYSTSCG